MHPAYQPNFPIPHPHPQNHRAWSDDRLATNHFPTSPVVRPGPRSSSFSASRGTPPPMWGSYPTPPPVPPLPSSLLPRFHSPSLAHANLDFTFAEIPQYHPSGPSHSFNPPAPSSGPPHGTRPPFDSDFRTRSSPVVPPRPTTSYTPSNVGARRPASSHSLVQSVQPFDYSSSPPPAIPPRPTTAHGEVRFERSPSIYSQPATQLPPIPPKTLTSPISSPLPFPGSGLTSSTPVMERPPQFSHNPNSIPEVSENEIAHHKVLPPSEPLLTDDLKRVMSLSLAESCSVNETPPIQDDDLARALAESLTFSTKLPQKEHIPQNRVHTSEATSSNATPSFIQNDASPSNRPECRTSEESVTRRTPYMSDPGGRHILSLDELAVHEAHGKILQELQDDEETKRLQEEESQRLAAELNQEEERRRKDEQVIRRLQEEENQRQEVEKREREKLDEERARRDEELARREEAEEKAQNMIRQAQERKDAEMARRMAETSDTAPAPVPAPQYVSPPVGKHGSGNIPGVPGLPQYNDVVSSTPVPGSSRPPPPPRSVQSAPATSGSSSQVKPSRAVSAIASGNARPVEDTEFSRSSTVTGGSGGRCGDGSSAPTWSQNPPSQGSRDGPGPSRVAPGPPPLDNAVEPDLLKGISYGFKPLDTRSGPAQMGEVPPCPPFPEVISLFRAPSPPFHIMAPSWRHLMRLLAQLETRIEANLDVIASTKEDNYLRVVVQFVKLPYTANTWRTILHLTLDQPIPRNTQNAWRFTNGDTTVLPYSYSLADPLPYLVTSPLSQIYVIPLSASSPFPILPIALPNLALYLQSAMRDSRARKVQADPSNGMRRLAKIVTASYPEEVVNSDKEERKPSRGVGNLFKRVVGRGNQDRESQGNEDVYDIITPFRIDQYTIS